MAGGGAEVSTLEKTPSEQQARGDELLCRNVGRAEVHLRLGLDSELRELQQRSMSQNGEVEWERGRACQGYNLNE